MPALSLFRSAFAASLILSLAACGDDPPAKIKAKPPAAAVAPARPAAPTIDAAAKPAPVAQARPGDGTDRPAQLPVTSVGKPAVALDPPASASKALTAARELAEAGDADQAIELLVSAASRWPKVAEVRVELARQYLADDQPRAARAHAVKATELRPEWSSAWNTLGRVELATGALAEAIAAFEHAVEANEENHHAWNNLGYALILDEQWQAAADALEAACDADEVEPYMWNNLGMAYEHLDRLDEARAAYDQGAAGGSEAAKASRARLQGVKSIAPAE